ncbi:hypothetical protein O181_056447 [Austropuccinia psidii MF-1]|uniref:Carboxylic ester hydrolase n=1 Tax=Austropuccinia psidii MF-1 TaxID=1389203 RepID=A0A9Q3HUF9_9BASI|nr:hypothetical protein [Austropuccinia psidii MF-1]
MYLSLALSLGCLVNTIAAVDSLVDLGYTKYQGLSLSSGVNQWLSLRFAAPVTGALRFSKPQLPLQETRTQDATKEGALCLAANKPEGLQYGSPRQKMAEDCLFAAVYAPAGATESSKLPIMFFIQGGGFMSNSNGNFNGSGLVHASGMKMIVVRINYRVGILGFIGGTLIDSDKKGAAPNNGLNDIIAAAQWVKKYATKFGGDPNHIVLSGVSAGGNAIDLLLSAHGTGFPNLFAGAMVESTGWGAVGFSVNRDAELTNNLNSTGCLSSKDPIDCMRMMPISEFQSKITPDYWGPTVDGQLILAHHYQMFEQGKFQKVPVIYGYTSNEGTPDYISNQGASTDADIEKHLRESVGPSMTDGEVEVMMKAYPPSLNDVSFFGRNVRPRGNVSLRQGKGPQWQRDAAIQTELKLHCVGAFFSDMFAAAGETANFAYRYNILDETPGGFAEKGLFSPHASELYAIWGSNNTDGGDPGCLGLGAPQALSCAPGASLVQHYWISFVRSLNPNTFRSAGSPEWRPWTINEPNRIVFDNKEATMEKMGQGLDETVVNGMNQRKRCLCLTTNLAKRINVGLGKNETLPPFANGTKPDPTRLACSDTRISTNQNGAEVKLPVEPKRLR